MDGEHRQLILKGKDWISTSPNSEFIVDVNTRVVDDGLTNILLKITVWLLPLVTLLLSGTDCPKILIPPEILEIVKVPKNSPLEILIDWIIAWFDEIIELTIKTVLKLKLPATIEADPIVSPTFNDEILK